MASQARATSWLTENGPRELELLFRAIVFHPSAPILLADNDRHYREASVGASKLLGLPREKIIGRKLDDFAEPGFKPVISERWRAFLEEGEQEGTLQLVGPDGDPREVEYIGQRQRVAGAPSPGAARQDRQRCRQRPGGGDEDPSRAAFRPGCRTMRCSCWMRKDGSSPGMRERSAFTATRAMRSSANTCRCSIPTKTALRVRLQEELKRAADRRPCRH